MIKRCSNSDDCRLGFHWPCENVKASVTLTNNGDFTTDIVTQLFLKVHQPSVSTDNIRLVNFTKDFSVAPRQSVAIEMEVNYAQMTVTEGYNYKQMIENGTYEVFIGSYLTMDAIVPACERAFRKRAGTQRGLMNCNL